MFYIIAPLVKLPLSKKPGFTYSSSKELAIGTLVGIDFSGKKLGGIVLEKTNRPYFKTKTIEKIIEPALLTSRQLSLAKKISEYYFSSLGVVLKLFVPKLTKKETGQEAFKTPAQNQPNLTKHQKIAINKITSSRKVFSFLLFGPASSGKTEVIMGVIEKILEQGKQALVLVPEIFLSYQEIARYTDRFKNKTVVLFHSGLKPSQRSFVYNQVKNGSVDIVISTRMGAFLPFRKLGLVAIDEEQDVSFKQWDQKPYYHVRKVSKELAKLFKAKLMLISGTPSLESIHWSKNAQHGSIKLPALKTQTVTVSKPSFIFGNLRAVTSKKQGIIFTPELEKALEETFRKKGIAYILVPRRGKSQLVVCSDCNKILECPICNTPLNHHNDAYRCLHCSFVTSNFAQCTKCKSFRLIDVGFGTNSAADTLKKHFPSLKIKIADQDTFKDNKKRGALLKSLSNNELDVLIGTYAIAKGLDIKHAMLACVLNAENWSGKADFRFDERRMSNLFQLAGRVNRPGSAQKGICLIQTYKCENKMWTFLKKWDWEKFVTHELHERKQLQYPPYQKMIKLSCKDLDKQKVEKNTQSVYTSLLKHKSNGLLEVYAPFYGHRKKIRGLWQKNILLKTRKKISAPLGKMLMKLKDNWNIDIDPENIF